MTSWDETVDFLVVGSGAAGMTGAMRAHDLGARTLVVEKAPVYGGSTALSGGVVWVPNNPLMRQHGIADSPDEALTYLQTITAGTSRRERIQAYINAAPRMMANLAERSHVRFDCVTSYPDYYPEIEGGKPGGRSCEPVVFDALRLGAEFARMRFPAPVKLMLGGRIMVNVNDSRLLLSGGGPLLWYILRRLCAYYSNLRARRRGRRVTDLTLGTALAGRLRLSLTERGVPLWLDTPLRELLTEGGRVLGAVVDKNGTPLRVRAKQGVLLAAGGFERNAEMRRRFQQAPIGSDWTVGCPSNTGDTVALAESVDAGLDLMDEAWWCPCTLAPFPADDRAWIMIFEKNLPGCMIVNKAGRRFMNEAAPYNDVGKSMYRANTPEAPAIPGFFIFDSTYRNKYPCGALMPRYAAPDRVVAGKLGRGFLERDPTLEGLAHKIGVDAGGLVDTVDRFNRCAASGKDLDFHRGDSLQDRYYTSVSKAPNPTLGAIAKPPFYAVRVFPGDLGTKGGLRTDENGRVLTTDNAPIAGLYAAGNCSATVMGRTYPGAGATIGPAMTFGFLAAEHAAGAPQRGNE